MNVSSPLDELVQKWGALPPRLQSQVLDFVDFLLNREVVSAESMGSKKTELSQGSERTLGLHEGQVWISNDFDLPLPDEFWLGNE